MKSLKKNKKDNKKRQKCEFNNCECTLYIGEKDGRCDFCSHGDIWHKLRYTTVYFKKEPTTSKDLNDYPN